MSTATAAQLHTCGSCLYLRTDIRGTGKGKGMCLQHKQHPIFTTKQSACPFYEKFIGKKEE